MDKPVKETHEYYNYDECAKYIAHKLGVKDLRDFAGRHANEYNETLPYQDFWHVLLDHNEIHNGCFVHLPEIDDLEEDEQWAIPIIEAWQEEFEPIFLEEYWVSW